MRHGTLFVPRALAWFGMVALLAAAPAFAGEAAHVELLYGASILADDYSEDGFDDSTAHYGAGWVYQTSGIWHVEIRGLYSETDQLEAVTVEDEPIDALTGYEEPGVPTTHTEYTEREGSLVTVSFNARTMFNLDSNVHPYLTFGGGPAIVEHGSDYAFYNVGGGMFFHLSSAVGLLGDIRYVGPFNEDDDIHGYHATIGASFKL